MMSNRPVQRWAHRSENNFIFLLLGLMVTLLLAPPLFTHTPYVMSIAFSLTLLIGVWSLARSRWAYIAGWSLAGASLLINLLKLSPVDTPNLFLLQIVLFFLFCAIGLVIAFHTVLFDDQVDFNRVVGSLCVYLMLGLNWSLMYSVVYFFDRDAFKGLPSLTDEGTFFELIYFSFVTLTTLGYGDVTPVSRLARSLAYMEAACGVMYLAVLVASLVGAYTAGGGSGKAQGK